MANDNTTWEPLVRFAELYPNVQLEDELFMEARRDVMTGHHVLTPKVPTWLDARQASPPKETLY